jgi:hypothetical protein
MKPKMLVLSVLLAVSIILNIVFLSSKPKAPENQPASVITAADVNNIENLSSKIYSDINRSSAENLDWIVASSKRFIMKLQYLKTQAEKENASETANAIDGMITSTKKRLHKLAENTGVNLTDSNSPERETTYRQRQERRRRILEQQRKTMPKQPLPEEE